MAVGRSSDQQPGKKNPQATPCAENDGIFPFMRDLCAIDMAFQWGAIRLVNNPHRK
ncbi:MAG: hypothetical protein HC789_06000 [Microcoleus sp. CSU_2_2]|nr:hypothetical protein [Microcoleus sp. CSU_2_2]